MNKETLTLGEIAEKELVEKFGSDAQKKAYLKAGKFTSAYKQALFKKLNRYCEIKDLGNRNYEIKKIYDYPLPANFNKMNSSLYQYIIPLILNMLVSQGRDKGHRIDITLGNWARSIRMINHNYNLCKYNQEGTKNMSGYPIEVIGEFFEKSDDMIDWYITNALDYLKSAGLIIWREIYNVTYEVSDGKAIIESDGTINIGISIKTKKGNKAEVKYYSECIEIADKAANITSESDRYYSKKAGIWKDILERELYKKKIRYIYKTYEAYYIDIDKCNALLNQFKINDMDNLIKGFNKTFTDMIITNAEKRYDKNPYKYKICSDKTDYSLCFNGLCEMVIWKDTEYLGKRINKKTLKDDYVLNVIEMS